MDFLAVRHNSKSARCRSIVVVAAMSAALNLGLVDASAQAHAPDTAKAWGHNNFGQLGDGTKSGPETCEGSACSTTPVAVTGLSGVVAMAGGGSSTESYKSVALLEDMQAADWGRGEELGDGEKYTSEVPVAVCAAGQTAPCAKDLEGATAISAGTVHALALLSNGTVVAWGSNLSGQLGTGTHQKALVPEPVCAVGARAPCSEESRQLKEVIAIAAGGEFSLALLKDGTVVAWGDNSAGELGDGTTESSTVPVVVSGLEKVTAIAAGLYNGLALLENGTVEAWGDDEHGQLGNGGETKSEVPVTVGGLSQPVTAIAAGEEDSLALLANGAVVSWGANADGELGTGTSAGPELCGTAGACSKAPVSVCAGDTPGPCPIGPYLSGVGAISAGGRHNLALLVPSGEVKAWGLNTHGQLGDGTSTGPETCTGGSCSSTPVAVSGLVGAQGIAGGGEHSLAFGPPPTVSAVEPDAGLEGKETTVTITGEDFSGASEVKFGSTSATSFSVKSDSSIEATAPAGAGTVDVTVANDWGTSATGESDKFTYVAPGPPPTVTRLKPAHGPATGGTTVTIFGANFAGVTAVKFGSRNAESFKVASHHRRRHTVTVITAVSSPGSPKTVVNVTVTTPNGTSALSRKDHFRYRRV